MLKKRRLLDTVLATNAFIKLIHHLENSWNSTTGRRFPFILSNQDIVSCGGKIANTVECLKCNFVTSWATKLKFHSSAIRSCIRVVADISKPTPRMDYQQTLRFPKGLQDHCVTGCDYLTWIYGRVLGHVCHFSTV